MSSEIRASEIKQFDLYKVPGDFEPKIAAVVSQRGDSVLVDGAGGEIDTLDIDTVVIRYSMDEIGDLLEEHGS